MMVRAVTKTRAAASVYCAVIIVSRIAGWKVISPVNNKCHQKAQLVSLRGFGRLIGGRVNVNTPRG